MSIFIEEHGGREGGWKGGREGWWEGRMTSQQMLRCTLASKQANSGEALKYTGGNIPTTQGISCLPANQPQIASFREGSLRGSMLSWKGQGLWNLADLYSSPKPTILMYTLE